VARPRRSRRIADPGELEWLGLADLASEPHLFLIEWPERGRGAQLPAPDLVVQLEHAGAARDVRLQPVGDHGSRWVASMKPDHPAR
jgi:tRNA threonylcarbamoyladenosine biosynthesis protein TsaE